MNAWLNRLVWDSNGRALTVDEAERVADYAESLPDRLAAAAAVDEARKWLARQIGDAVSRRATDWGLPREPLAQDFVAALTPVVTAMLADDPDVLPDAVVRPFERLAAALDVPAAEVGDLFATAWRALATRLDPKSTRLLAPYFARVIEMLGAAAATPADPTPALAG